MIRRQINYLISIFLSIFLFGIYQTAFGRDIIIDTDVGIDDAMAIAYVLTNQRDSVKAITIEADGCNCEIAYNYIKAITQYFHVPNIPIACGQSTPLEGNNHYPPLVMDADKIAAESLPQQHFSPHRDAISLLYQTLKKANAPVDMLTIGPLTNIAQLFKSYPDSKKAIHALWIMGGAINVRGNIQDVSPKDPNAYAEWNFYIDPTAANEVIASSVPIMLIPLDLTNTVPLNWEIYHLFESNKNTPLNDFLFHLIQLNKKFMASGQWYFWDPMAAVLMLNSTFFSCHEAKLVVLPSGPKKTEGRVLVDNKNGNKVTVCTKIPSNRAFYTLLTHSSQ